MSLELGFQKASDVFSVEDLLEAKEALARANVPPWECPECARRYYVVLRYWADEPSRDSFVPKSGPSFFVQCECGHRGKIANHSLPIGAPYTTLIPAKR